MTLSRRGYPTAVSRRGYDRQQIAGFFRYGRAMPRWLWIAAMLRFSRTWDIQQCFTNLRSRTRYYTLPRLDDSWCWRPTKAKTKSGGGCHFRHHQWFSTTATKNARRLGWQQRHDSEFFSYCKRLSMGLVQACALCSYALSSLLSIIIQPWTKDASPLPTNDATGGVPRFRPAFSVRIVHSWHPIPSTERRQMIEKGLKGVRMGDASLIGN